MVLRFSLGLFLLCIFVVVCCSQERVAEEVDNFDNFVTIDNINDILAVPNPSLESLPEHAHFLLENTAETVEIHSHLRRLQTKGTNCVVIERGTVPRYYTCTGCVSDRAFACLDDMRQNKSGNVPTDCGFHAASERYLPSCCPRLHFIPTESQSSP